MLFRSSGRERPVGSQARGVTAKSHFFAPFDLGQHTVELVDTVGLHESLEGTVPADQAALALVDLLQSAREGFHLMIHVSRAGRLTRQHEQDHELFVEQLTQHRVPCLLVVTGCENEEPMTQWVEQNRASFERFGYAGIVATCFGRGGPLESHFAPLRQASREAVLAALARHALPEPALVYGGSTAITFNEALSRLWNAAVEILGLPARCRRQVNESAYALLKRVGVPDEVADLMVAHIPELMEEVGNKLPVPMLGRVLRQVSTQVLQRWHQSRGSR